MRVGTLLVEAKLTESDFQTRAAALVEAYRDFDEVFDRDLLPRVELQVGRRKEAAEFPEDYSQEHESFIDLIGLESGLEPVVASGGVVALPKAHMPLSDATEPAYASYQLIRNVLAAHAQDCSFCVIHDHRRPDLREAWFQVMAAVKSAALRTRLKVLTWQELVALLAAGLGENGRWRSGRRPAQGSAKLSRPEVRNCRSRPEPIAYSWNGRLGELLYAADFSLSRVEKDAL